MARKYIFTDKRESRRGMISTVLGITALAAIGVAVFDTFQNQGQALVKDAMAVLLSLLFALAGLVLGILSRLERDRFYLFSWLGIGLNLLAAVETGLILYAGVYGI